MDKHVVDYTTAEGHKSSLMFNSIDETVENVRAMLSLGDTITRIECVIR